MFLTIFLRFQHWVQLSFTVHIRGGGGEIAGDVQRKIPLEHHCCEAVFSKLVHYRIRSCNNAISQSRPFLYSTSYIVQIDGSLLSACSGFWTTSCFFWIKITQPERTQVSVVAAVAAHSWVGGWVDTEWSLTLVTATSTIPWVTQLPALPVLPCSQIPPCGFAFPRLTGCQCKVLNTCFTEPLSSGIRQLWVIWLCRLEHCGLLGRAQSGSPTEVRLQQVPRSNQWWDWACIPSGHAYTDTLKTHTKANSSPSDWSGWRSVGGKYIINL